MRKVKGVPLLVIVLFLVIALSGVVPNQPITAKASPTTPYQGSGALLDVHEFARNNSGSFAGQNGTAFSYNSSRYPSGYRGYQLSTNVSQVRRFTDPLPNGSFEDTTAFSSTWNLTNLEPGDPIITSLSPETAPSPTDGLYVMDVELPHKKMNGQRTAYIDNDFNYTSEFFPDDTEVRFDIRLEDISDKDWLFLRVAIWNQGSEKGVWSYDLKTLKADIGEDSWSSQQFFTSSVNGQIKLRITLFKQTPKNEDVKGHIYFDNFRYIIGSDVTPSEAGLTLNGEPFLDAPSGPSGSVDIFADAEYGEDVPWANCWSTDQQFQFDSPIYSNITFYYKYAMHVKTINPSVATTNFSAPIDGTPIWNIYYTVPSGRPPTDYEGYAFGLHLSQGWTCFYANDSLGTPVTYSVNLTSNFVKLDEDEAISGQTYSLYATSVNYVQTVILQKSDTGIAPWENVTSSDYFVIGDYLRVIAELRPFELDPSNFGNVEVHYPNGTLWQYDDSVFFDEITDTLVSTAWQINGSDVDDAIIGQDWIATVSFDNGTQCGKRQGLFTVVVETSYTKIDPTDGTNVIWGDSVYVEVNWQNTHTGNPITDAFTARVRYLDRNLVVQYVTMTPDGLGNYSTDVSTTLMSPDRNAQIHVELFKYGCQNASYADGTQITFTINLINKLNLIMIKPTLITGPNEFTGETSAIEGYTSIVKFYDPYQGAYVLNESGTWPNVFVNYTSYEDPDGGPAEWIFLGNGTFSHDTVERTFSKHDSGYVGVERVKYEVSMRIEGASWDFEKHNFTIIINIVSWATDLDALRTSIEYPPTGDGWTQFDQTSDNYDVHLYWNEQFNVTVFYHLAGSTTGLPGADERSIKIGAASPQNMNDITGGHYQYMIDTSSLDLGLTTIIITVTEPGYASQTISIQLFIEARQTVLTKDQPGSTAIIPWGSIFSVTFSYNDTVESLPIPIPDGNVVVQFTSGSLPYSIINHTDGTYTVSFTGNTDEGSYSIIIFFTRDKYQSQNQIYELTIRLIATQTIGLANTPTVSWGENAIITLTFTDIDNSLGISSASFNFTSHGIWLIEGVDYWVTDLGNGDYNLTLNTTQVPIGTHGYTLFFTFTKDHYQTSQTAVFFQVRDIQTILFITDTPDGTIIPHGDVFTLILQYNNTDHIPSTIIGNAVIDCDWDPFFWNYTYDAGQGIYIVMVQTRIRDEGTFILNFHATKPHYQDGSNIQTFVIRTIQTSAETHSHITTDIPIGDNASFYLHYNDTDHLGQGIPFANVSINWDTGFYSIIDFGNGEYYIELNTSSGIVGPYDLQINVGLPPHYNSRTLFVTIEIVTILLTIQIEEPNTPSIVVEFNTEIVLTVNVTDSHGSPINDAIVEYQWAGRVAVNMTWIGNGRYNVTFLANASVGPSYTIQIRAYHPTKYVSDLTTFSLIIDPVDTILTRITSSAFPVVAGETFELSVNFTTLNGMPIDDAIVAFLIRNASDHVMFRGNFTFVGSGIYHATIDSTELLPGIYEIYVDATKLSMRTDFTDFQVTLTRIPVDILVFPEEIQVFTNHFFLVRVTLTDYYGQPILDANLTIVISNLLDAGELMTNHENGTYSYIGNSGFIAGLYQITIDTSTPPQYVEPETMEIVLLVRTSPVIEQLSTYVAVAAIIIVLLLALWLAYTRVFSVPWMVRKMRKMSKSIGKGDIPPLSKTDIMRISDRPDQLTELVNPYYGAIGIPASTAVLPAEIDWKEKDAEDEAIWGELKNLPMLEYEQRLELFQQMKQIAPSERVWFLDDLKKQMADKTRFARKVKEPEISEDLEQELQARLATFPALSNIEKTRIAAQLRKLPKEEWDEIFHTLAASQKQPTPQVEVLAPDEFPSLSEEEKQRVLEQIKDLSEEEREKVLQTLRDKRAEGAPKGKVVKGKKEFVIDDSSESK
jgi:hypothetical protein